MTDGNDQQTLVAAFSHHPPTLEMSLCFTVALIAGFFCLILLRNAAAAFILDISGAANAKKGLVVAVRYIFCDFFFKIILPVSFSFSCVFVSCVVTTYTVKTRQDKTRAKTRQED